MAQNKFTKYAVALALYVSFIISMAVLWVIPFWGFHNDFSLGILAWVFFTPEGPHPGSIFYDGCFEIVPTCFGMNLLLTVGATWAMWRAFIPAFCRRIQK